MTSNKPYLLRALYEWILDNGLTPHIIVDVHAEGVEVPPQAVRDGKLVLNVAPQATRNLELGNEFVNFQARFSGAARDILLPTDAVMAIYAKENGQGMMFARDNSTPPPPVPEDDKPAGAHLKVIK